MALLLLLIASFVAGAINAVAGGGTLLTFPSLLAAGVSPVMANATSTVALVPGSFGAFHRYRADMPDWRAEWLWMGVPSLVGGGIGALIVVRAGDEIFARLVPWLILSASTLFLLQDPIRRALERRGAVEARSHRWAGALFQLLVSIYGGFFGAGMGILMLAALSVRGVRDVHYANGLKNLAAVCINGVAAISFAVLGKVRWPLALMMAVTALAGGVVGASLAKRAGQRAVRATIVVIGFAIGVWTLLRR